MKRVISLVLSLILAVGTIGIVPAVSAQAVSNKQIIYTYLTNDIGLNTAAACGLMSNMYYESSYSPTTSAYGYYGLFQWGSGDRLNDLISYCKNNNLDYHTLEGQLRFIKYELKNVEKTKYKYLKSVKNTPDGAYAAAYYWCYYYEIPANRKQTSVKRGNYAKLTLFSQFSGKKVKAASLSSTSKTMYLSGSKKDNFHVNWVGYSVSKVMASSSSTSVVRATVSTISSSAKKINLTAKKAGTATITVKLLDKKGKTLTTLKCKVTVKPVSYTSERWKITAVNGVNCRKSASTSSKKIKLYSYGTTLTVTSIRMVGKNKWAKTKDGWFAIRYNGETLASYTSNYLYKISYNANGGKGAPGATGKRYGVSRKLSTAKPTRSGCTFLGWAAKKGAAKATYKPGAKITKNANLKLYAVWQFNKSASKLKVKSRTSTTVTLSWAKATGATGYRIYCATSKNGKYKHVATVKGTSKVSCTVKSLKRNKQYYFKVRAYKVLPQGAQFTKYTGVVPAKTKK